MKRLAFTVVAVALVAAGIYYYYRGNTATAAPAIVTATVTRGDVVQTVDCTGTLQAVTTVQVGTQVSGTIKTLNADFNSRVRRGQVVAELEPSLFQAQVEQARASLTRLEAELWRTQVQRDDAQRKLKRAQELSNQQLIPATDLETAEMNAREAEASIRSAEAQITQAKASLNQSEVNLAHTIIRAPIDGIVISRNVDVGQTVAASMQAPTLFVIARDLREMQVNASVAESDIGLIQAAQPVTFRVDAYPGEVFSGRVAQVRLEPVVEQNVVSYVTTIDVPNLELKLKPGMTANVTIEIAKAPGVLRVPNAALRVRPSDDVLAALGHPAVPPSRAPGVWVSVAGRLEKVPVQAGITDGSHTAILSGALTEGALVVTSIASTGGTTSTSTTTTSTSPFLPSRPGRTGTTRQPGPRTP